jgi:4-diphosphocytidyl-2-C-methyl-D-erythritol kinase
LDLHFVIVRPATGLATATVFRHCRPAEQRESVQPLLEALRHGRLGRVASLLHNRLQAPAEALNADVTRLKQHFSKLPVLGHLMSGSGTSYFGLCANRQQGLRVAARLKAVRAGEVFVARSRP